MDRRKGERHGGPARRRPPRTPGRVRTSTRCVDRRTAREGVFQRSADKSHCVPHREPMRGLVMTTLRAGREGGNRSSQSSRRYPGGHGNPEGWRGHPWTIATSRVRATTSATADSKAGRPMVSEWILPARDTCESTSVTWPALSPGMSACSACRPRDTGCRRHQPTRTPPRARPVRPGTVRAGPGVPLREPGESFPRIRAQFLDRVTANGVIPFSRAAREASLDSGRSTSHHQHRTQRRPTGLSCHRCPAGRMIPWVSLP